MAMDMIIGTFALRIITIRSILNSEFEDDIKLLMIKEVIDTEMLEKLFPEFQRQINDSVIKKEAEQQIAKRGKQLQEEKEEE